MTIDKFFARKMQEEIRSKGRGYQAKLAAQLGIKTGTLSNRLSGTRGTTEDQRREMCVAMGIDYSGIVQAYNQENHNNGERCVLLMAEGIFT